MFSFDPNNVPKIELDDIEIDLPETDFASLYATVFRRLHRFYQPLTHTEHEKQVIDAATTLAMRHLFLLQEYVMGELGDEDEPDLETLHCQFLGLRRQAFQWDYGDGEIGRSAHVATAIRNMFFSDFATLHYLADQLVEEHWGRGCDVEIVVKLSAHLPVPAKRAKKFVLGFASKPTLSRDDYNPLITDISVRRKTSKKNTAEDEEE